MIGEVEKDFKWLTNNSEKIIQTRDYSDLPAMHDKIENIYDKYKDIF